MEPSGEELTVPATDRASQQMARYSTVRRCETSRRKRRALRSIVNRKSGVNPLQATTSAAVALSLQSNFRRAARGVRHDVVCQDLERAGEPVSKQLSSKPGSVLPDPRGCLSGDRESARGVSAAQPVFHRPGNSDENARSTRQGMRRLGVTASPRAACGPRPSSLRALTAYRRLPRATSRGPLVRGDEPSASSIQASP